MSKNWYPVIDYNECSECGTCVDFCPHDVYDKESLPGVSCFCFFILSATVYLC